MSEDREMLKVEAETTQGHVQSHVEVQRVVTVVQSKEGCFCHLCNAAISADTPHLILVTTFPTELSSFLSRSRVCLECLHAIAQAGDASDSLAETT